MVINIEKTLKQFIKEEQHVNYAIIDVSKCANFRLFEDTDNPVKLIDLFQKLNSDYLFLHMNTKSLVDVFSIYPESSFELTYLIPWLKINFNESNVIEMTSKYMSNVNFVGVFQKCNSARLKSKLKSVIIEEDMISTLNRWQRELISDLNSWGLTGMYVSLDGIVLPTTTLTVKKPKNQMIELF